METLLHIERSVKEQLESQLKKTGLMYRLFSRVKDDISIEEKILRKDYGLTEKKMTDIIGFRITSYFIDDVLLVFQYFKDKLNFYDENYETPSPNIFGPIRKNLTCYMNDGDSKLMDELIATNDKFNVVHKTFEIQFRTTLSEGWHEVDHNMRYKCKDEWESLDHEHRLFNGIYAALEAHDYSMKALFDDLAYGHYKKGNWEAMIRNKFRLRFQLKPLNEDISKILSENDDLAKALFKIDRIEFLKKVIYSEMRMPTNMNYLLYLLNHIELKDAKLTEITPPTISEDFNFYLKNI